MSSRSPKAVGNMYCLNHVKLNFHNITKLSKLALGEPYIGLFMTDSYLNAKKKHSLDTEELSNM